MFGNLKKSAQSMAQKTDAAGFTVEASYGEEYVRLVRKTDRKTVTELTGEDAVSFINYAEDLATAAGIDLETAMLAEAKPYADVQ